MKKVSFNSNWQFYKENCESSIVNVDLPHDAMILEKRDPASINGAATGFLPGGKYYYIKKFFAGSEFSAGTILIEFEGIYMNSSVFLNGEYLGGHIFGYSNFYIDLTGRIRVGFENELKVIADNSLTPNSRWYSGSGIYRNVNLWIGDETYIKPEGIRVKTLSHTPAVIEINIDTVKSESCFIEVEVLYKDEVIARKEGSYASILIPDAKLWSAEDPNLYSVKAVIKRNGMIIDSASVRFGIRTLAWDAKSGFQVNGISTKLRGGCIHHDHGILGACTFDKAEFRRVKILREFGFNAIRYSHNPASKNFLEACDEIGMYVIDESFDQWRIPQTTYDYALYFDEEWQKDITALVSKDYCHPSVIMYCVGNETSDTGLPTGAAICKDLSNFIKKLDDTRPTMIAINSMLSVLAAMNAKQTVQGNEETVGSKEVNDIVAMLPEIMKKITPESLEEIIGESLKAVDIVGYNYSHGLYEGTHKIVPDRVILSSETFPSRMASNWDMVLQNDYVIGDFHWTAWDYLGESGAGTPLYGTTIAPFSKEYPCFTAACGSIDLTGFPESAAYYVAILWGVYQHPYIGVRPINHSGEEYTLGKWRMTDSISCWTWPDCEDRTAQIEVFSIGYEIELFQDGNSLGRKQLVNCKCVFETAYHPGELIAVSYSDSGMEIARSELKSASNTFKLEILPEETNIGSKADDVIFVPIHIVDTNGVLQMTTNKRISVNVEGPGRLIAFGSGYPDTTESYQSDSFTSWHGRVLAVIKCTGEIGVIRIKATADSNLSAYSEVVVFQE